MIRNAFTSGGMGFQPMRKEPEELLRKTSTALHGLEAHATEDRV